METRRFRIALFALDQDLWRQLSALDQFLNTEKFYPRLVGPIDVAGRDDEQTARMILQNYATPFAVIAVTGTNEEVERAAKAFVDIRKRVPTMLVMSPSGYRHMRETFDPCLAFGHPSHSQDVVGSVLLGDESEFPDYLDTQFGKPVHLSPLPWDVVALRTFADTLTKVARPPKRALAC